MAAAVAERRFFDVGYYISVIFSYVMGLAVFRRLDLCLKDKSTMSICALCVMALFVGSDCVNLLSGGMRWVPMMMLAAGFGIINSIGQEVSGVLTFVVTGHMTRLTNLAIDRVSRTAGRKKLGAAGRAGAYLNAGVITGFFAGALWASVLMTLKVHDKFGVVSAIGILYGALFLWQDMESLGGAWWLRKDGAMCDNVDDDGSLCTVIFEESD